MTTERVPAEIKATPLQSRASVNRAYVDELAELMKVGVQVPPIPIFQNGTEQWLPDGLHRLEAATKAHQKIPVEFHQGTREQALEFGMRANATHGLRRTNADKRVAVQLALESFGDRSDEAIAQLCGVTRRFVVGIRTQIKNSEKPPNNPQPVNDSQVGEITNETRVGLNDKSRRLPRQSASAHTRARKPGEVIVDVRLWEKFDSLFGKLIRCVDELNHHFPDKAHHEAAHDHLCATYKTIQTWKMAPLPVWDDF